MCPVIDCTVLLPLGLHHWVACGCWRRSWSKIHCHLLLAEVKTCDTENKQHYLGNKKVCPWLRLQDNKNIDDWDCLLAGYMYEGMIFTYNQLKVSYFSRENFGTNKLKINKALRAISWIRNNVRLILFFLDGREGGRGYFTVLNSLTDMREHPRIRRFMPLRAAIWAKKHEKSQTKSEKKNVKWRTLTCHLIPFAVYK